MSIALSADPRRKKHYLVATVESDVKSTEASALAVGGNVGESVLGNTRSADELMMSKPNVSKGNVKYDEKKENINLLPLGMKLCWLRVMMLLLLAEVAGFKAPW